MTPQPVRSGSRIEARANNCAEVAHTSSNDQGPCLLVTSVPTTAASISRSVASLTGNRCSEPHDCPHLVGSNGLAGASIVEWGNTLYR